MKAESLVLLVLVLRCSISKTTVSRQTVGIRMCQQTCLKMGQCVSLCYSPQTLRCTWKTYSQKQSRLHSFADNSWSVAGNCVRLEDVGMCHTPREMPFINMCSSNCPQESRLLTTRLNGQQCVSNKESCPPPPNLLNAKLSSDFKLGRNSNSVCYVCVYGFCMVGRECVRCIHGQWEDLPGKCYRLSYKPRHLNISKATSTSPERISAYLPYPWATTDGFMVFIIRTHQKTDNWTVHFSCDTDIYTGFRVTGHEVCCRRSFRPEQNSICRTLNTTGKEIISFNVNFKPETFRMITYEDNWVACKSGRESSCVRNVVISGNVEIVKIRLNPKHT